MGSRHDNCMGNSSGKLPRNVSNKCYSLPTLQRENEKLKHDLNVLQAAYDEKEILLTESFSKVNLLDEQNHELKSLLKSAVVANEEKVEMRDASTCATNETKNKSTWTSLATVDKQIQVEMEDSTISVTVEAENGSTSSAVSYSEIKGDGEARSKTLLFDELVRELPYDGKTEIIILNENLKDPKLSSNMREHFQKIGGATTSKVVNNILNAIATKNLQKQFVWDADASNSFQSMKNILSCIYSAVCSKEKTQQDVNNVIKNALKNARAAK